jgi:hypothetical protein
MRRYRFLAPMCLGLLVIAGCAAQQAQTSWQTSIPALQPDMARLWVLRMPSQAGFITGADPVMFANGTPVAQSTVNTVYYHDFPPGTYRLTVQAYGTPANLVDTLQLAPGTESYVQIQAIPNWEAGSTAGGASFAVLTMAPAEAKSNFEAMKFLGQR